MTQLKIALLAVVTAAGVAASMMIQHASQARFRERAASVLLQEQQLAGLSAEHQRLSNLVVNATNSAPPDERAAELVKLRADAEALKMQTNELGRQAESNRAARPVHLTRPAQAPESHPPEFYSQLQQMAGGKISDARYILMAFRFYADDHEEQFPSNFDQIASYLAKGKMVLSGTNQFDIVFQGSLDKLQGVPVDVVAVIRDQQVWAGPDGKMRRVYGMANGSVQSVGSDDNFQSWEAEHVIAPPQAGQ